MDNTTARDIRGNYATQTLGDQVEFIRNGMNVERYHQRPTLKPDLVGKHSCGVALFVNMINPFADKIVLQAAISHDLGEWITGDLPAPVKRALPPEARRVIDDMESQALAANGLRYQLSLDEEQILKLADYLDGLFYCIEEKRLGNRNMDTVAGVYINYIRTVMASSKEWAWYPKAQQVVMYVTTQWEQLR